MAGVKKPAQKKGVKGKAFWVGDLKKFPTVKKTKGAKKK